MAATSLSSSISSSITLDLSDDFLPAQISQPTTVPAEEQDKIAPWLVPGSSFDIEPDPVRLKPLHASYVSAGCLFCADAALCGGDAVRVPTGVPVALVEVL